MAWLVPLVTDAQPAMLTVTPMTQNWDSQTLIMSGSTAASGARRQEDLLQRGIVHDLLHRGSKRLLKRSLGIIPRHHHDVVDLCAAGVVVRVELCPGRIAHLETE